MSERSFFPNLRAAALAATLVAGLAAGSAGAWAQAAGDAPTAPVASGTVSAPTMGQQKREKQSKKEKRDAKVAKQDEAKAEKAKVVQSRDTKKAEKKSRKTVSLEGLDSKLPDKQLFDKAQDAMKKGHFDVARLDLQTLLNTYPDSQYQMQAKLAIADSWYKEGGTAALTQAESEYADFRVFFPNAPEAAEAQMRIGDIYFRQMDKPDRDYSKAKHAEEEYRRMLTDYPDSVLVPDAKQRLREVQEVMATREAEIGAFYSTHNNWPATIARYKTVVDSYPLYSHLDDVLVGLGDAYEAEAKYVRALKQLPEAAKARLEKTYDDQAADAYRQVVLEHAASPHVEDARERLEELGVPIPAPTKEQIEASTALENSRRQYRIQDRATLLFLHRPDVVAAARIGEPTLTDPKSTFAPEVTKQIVADFTNALNPNAKPVPATTSEAAAPAASDTTSTPAPATPAAPLALQEIPAAGAGDSGNTSTMTTAAPADASGGQNSVGVEVLTPGANTTAVPDNGGLKAVGPVDATPLPAVEKPAAAPDQINDIKPGTQPAAQTPAADGKKAKPEFDKGDESSSKHKKKKGLDKLNPF
ncbi:MAG: outer membrane protein assembly factor BamD [Acidobacteriota bacterium]|nr:outer membrane protein assembly factor BamD [Acidobacteriota bacterium]